LFAIFGLSLWFLSSTYKLEIYYYKNRILYGNTVSITNKNIKLPIGYSTSGEQTNPNFLMLYALDLGNDYRLVIEDSKKVKYPINEYISVLKELSLANDLCSYYQATINHEELPVYLIVNHQFGLHVSVYKSKLQGGSEPNPEKICLDLNNVRTTKT
jgi:hypothetical protein